MTEIQILIQSLSPKEKGDFRKEYSNPNNENGYFRLFDIANESNPVNEAEIAQSFSSSSSYSQAKRKIKETLLDFLGRRKSKAEVRAIIYFEATNKLLEKGCFAGISIALTNLVPLLTCNNLHFYLKRWLNLYALLPKSTVSTKLQIAAGEIFRMNKNWEQIAELEIEQKLLARKNNSPDPQNTEYQTLLHKVNCFISSPQTSNLLKNRAILIQRKLIALLGDYKMAIEISQKYLQMLGDLPIPSFQRQKLSIEELKVLSNLYLIISDHSSFLRTTNSLSSINFSFPHLRLKAVLTSTLNQIVWGSDFGIEELFDPIKARMRLLDNSKYFENNKKDSIVLLFYFSQFCFICQKFDDARNAIFEFESIDKTDPTYQLFFPFAVQTQIIISILKGEDSFFDSYESKYKRLLTEKSATTDFFRPFTKWLNQYKKTEITKFFLREINQELLKMEAQSDFSLGFSNSIFPDFILAGTQNATIAEIRRKKLDALPKELEDLLNQESA